jgi:hypothetical protein
VKAEIIFLDDYLNLLDSHERHVCLNLEPSDPDKLIQTTVVLERAATKTVREREVLLIWRLCLTLLLRVLLLISCR